jgi:outer membrane protein assembly factor BamB
VTSYNFGWDSTPAVYAHGSTYSIITKDNHYITNGPYFITQLSADLIPEWQYQNTTIDKDHPDGYEWCVNAPAVDKNGTVYANSEDGNVYVLNQDGTLKGNLFLQLAIGAAYTPVAIGLDGKIYAENDGDMFVIGN